MFSAVKMVNFRLFALLVFVNISPVSSVLAAQAASEPVYVKPVPIKRARPTYPASRLEQAQAGMVELELMVDKNGEVFEALVTDSSHPDFEAEAIEAVKKYQYQPATLNAQPVESRTNVRIIFIVDGFEDAVGDRFAKRYRKARKILAKESLSEKEQAALKRRLDRLADMYGLSLYGLAHLSLAESIYAQRFSTQAAQLDAYKKMLLYEARVGEEKQFLDTEVEKAAKIAITQLEAQLSRYGDAIRSYKTIAQKFPEAAKSLEPLMAKVQEIVTDDKPFATPLSLDKNGHQLYYLIKKNFSLLDLSKNVEELKVRCDRKFARLKFQAESDYTVPESWGKCYLEVIGEPNLTGRLIQF